MTTEKQISANQENAQKSTGPQSPEGKAVSSMNATKHGLLSRKVLLPDESRKEFSDFAQQIFEYLIPVGKVEESLANRIVLLFWRLRRLEHVETGIALRNHFNMLLEEARQHANSFVEVSGGAREFFESLQKPEKRTILDDEKHKEALDKVQSVIHKQKESTSCFSKTFMNDTPKNGKPVFERLSRYESSLERSLYRALHEFQALQCARKSQS